MSKNFRESDKFSEIGGKSEKGGEMHHGLRGDGRPWQRVNRNKPNRYHTLYSILKKNNYREPAIIYRSSDMTKSIGESFSHFCVFCVDDNGVDLKIFTHK